ncbi:MAG: pyridoxamine 5'-phosphate oxidase [Bacteroidales bacterium]
MNLSDYRENYSKYSLDNKDLPSDPVDLFNAWFKEVITSGLEDPTAMVLATADPSGQPSARMVLLKGLESRGYVFFTNYLSRKGHELSVNPQAALLFFWKEYQRQVRIEGRVQQLPVSESDQYFMQRPLDSRISAIISPQSRIIPDRLWLEEKVEKFIQDNPDGPSQRPNNWGGYLLVPQRYEFWQGRENRLHDRFQFSKEGNSWTIDRLAP